LSIILLPPEEFAIKIAARARERRLQKGLTQSGLAHRSGVSLGTLKRFERTGQIALVSLIRLATALGGEQGLENLFTKREFEKLSDVLEHKKPIKRGRIR